jgi:hypothetical protein
MHCDGLDRDRARDRAFGLFLVGSARSLDRRVGIELDVIEFVLIIERPDTDTSGSKRLVRDRHVGCLHVIEIDFNPPRLAIANQFNLMPLVIPWNILFVFGQWSAWLAIDNHDLPARGIGLGTQMHIIKVLGVLVAEKDAAVAMIAGIVDTANSEGENELALLQFTYQRYVVGAADLGLVVANPLVLTKRMIPLMIHEIPSALVGGIPTLASVLKVFFENEGQTLKVLVLILSFLPQKAGRQPTTGNNQQ